jgi:hypothetical protein
MVTWHTGFVQPQCEDTYIPCNVQFIYCNLEIYLGTQCATPFNTFRTGIFSSIFIINH